MAFTNHTPTLILTVLLLLLSPAPAMSQETEKDEHEFSYDHDSEKGPQHWGNIHEDWAACGTGELQSPIDLSDKRVVIQPHLRKLRRAYRPAAAVLKNRGHDIMLKFVGEEASSRIWIDGKAYALKQLHWHSPAEHTINGRRYALELHKVHESADKQIAVVGILYTIGRPDKFLAKIEEAIMKIGNLRDAEVEVGVIDPREVKRGSKKYYRYMGSLTVPPCTEGVVWSIAKKVRTVSKEQVEILKDAVHDEYHKNARPLQPINDRVVGMFRPKKIKE